MWHNDHAVVHVDSNEHSSLTLLLDVDAGIHFHWDEAIGS
jgi:hypothetical protein